MGLTESYRGPSGKILPEAYEPTSNKRWGGSENFSSKRGVALAYLFGSYAYGKVSSSSDVDIAILLERCKEGLYSSYREIMLGIREALGTERFDLVLLNNAPPTLQFEVNSQGRLIFCRDEEVLNTFEMDVIRRFQDTGYLRKDQNDYLKKRAREWYSKRKA